MPSFFKIKIYRTKFIIYLLFSALFCVIMSFFTTQFMLNSWETSAQADAVSMFNRTENTLQDSVSRIDIYMSRLYSTPDLMGDFRCFLGNNATEYLTKRIENGAPTRELYSFPNDIQWFLCDDGNGSITQINVHSVDNANILYFLGNGRIRVRFSVPNISPDFDVRINQGFVYHKVISDPSEISRKLGEFDFIISSKKIFESVGLKNLSTSFIMGKDGTVMSLTSDAESLNKWIPAVLRKCDVKNQGYIMKDRFHRLYYTVNTSAQFGYKLITIIDPMELFHKNFGTAFFVIMAFVALMFAVNILIMTNMQYDAKFLLRIMRSINRAKVGDFSEEGNVKYRKNEYGMIARELDDMSRKLEKHIRIEYVLKLKQQEAEMQALQHQINPHFLYNTLESIRSFALVNHDCATADAIADLGGMYREIVKNEDIIPMHKELDLLKKYLHLMEFKYPDNFYYQLNIEPVMLDILTVKLWMQPLAENFFAHGFDFRSEFNLLIVNGYEENEEFVIEFVNNGVHIEQDKLDSINDNLANPAEAGESIGLKNVYARLSYYYEDMFSMKVENNEEAGVKISVRIRKEATSHVSDVNC